MAQWLGAHADLPQIREAMLETAGRMGIAERVLPRIALPAGADGEFVFRDDRSLVYCGFERGSQFFEYRADEVDELLYRVFCDRAWTHAYLGLIGQELSPENHEVKLAAEQETLLALADPRWAERLVRERARLSET